MIMNLMRISRYHVVDKAISSVCDFSVSMFQSTRKGGDIINDNEMPPHI